MAGLVIRYHGGRYCLCDGMPPDGCENDGNIYLGNEVRWFDTWQEADEKRKAIDNAYNKPLIKPEPSEELKLRFLNKVRVLALLEAYRLYENHKKEINVDHVLRVASAIVADAFGFSSRADWCDEINKLKLVDYGHEVDLWNQYKQLTELVHNIEI